MGFEGPCQSGVARFPAVVDSRKVLVFMVVVFLVEMDCAGFPWFDGIRESQIGLPLQVKFQRLPTTAAQRGRWPIGIRSRGNSPLPAM